MLGELTLQEGAAGGRAPHVHRGPLLEDLERSAAASARQYVERGGYRLARRVHAEMSPAEVLAEVSAAGLRGRAGGGFPTGHKWALVQRSGAERRFFVCNAHAGGPGGFKERYLLRRYPHRVIEAVVVAMRGVDATAATVFVGREHEEEAALLERARDEAVAEGVEQAAQVAVVRSTGGYVSGEETAVLEVLEGREARPRRKPPMPASRGLWGMPTAVNNLETTLHALRIVQDGAEGFRRLGTRYAPGTQLFSLSGGVRRPGLYELPLGTPLGELIAVHGEGPAPGTRIKAVLPGGLGSRALGPQAFDVPLDHDALTDAGSELGSGAVIVVPDTVSAVDLAIELQRFFHRGSCGKCQPCHDGTRRALVMLERLDELDRQSVDLGGRGRPESPRAKGGLYVLPPDEERGGVSYTDMTQGLDKIRSLASFYKHRGDCHHPTEAAGALERLLDLFPEEFEARRTPRRVRSA